MSAELILLGGTIPIDEEDNATDNQVELQQEDTAFYESYSIDIQNAIGKEGFRPLYTSLINEIKERPFKDQSLFCTVVLEQIKEVYDFEFPTTIDLSIWQDIYNVYSFLEFIEFDHIEYFSVIWKSLNVNLKEIDIREYCEKNKVKILSKIEDELETYVQTPLITIFLRTYYKLIDWFVLKTEQEKMIILLEILNKEMEEK